MSAVLSMIASSFSRCWYFPILDNQHDGAMCSTKARSNVILCAARAAYATLPGHARGLYTANIVVTKGGTAVEAKVRPNAVVASEPLPDVLGKAT